MTAGADEARAPEMHQPAGTGRADAERDGSKDANMIDDTADRARRDAVRARLVDLAARIADGSEPLGIPEDADEAAMLAWARGWRSGFEQAKRDRTGK